MKLVNWVKPKTLMALPVVKNDIHTICSMAS